MRKKALFLYFRLFNGLIICLCAHCIAQNGDPNGTQSSSSKQVQSVLAAEDPNQTDNTIEENGRDNQPNEDSDESFDLTLLPKFYEACKAVFGQHVNTNGDVDYATLRRKRLELNTAVRLLDAIHPAQLMRLSNDEKLAFWLNAYNICTLKLIIDNYPIKPKLYMIFYPNNSIMQITNPWTTYFKIQGLEYNLKEIREELLLERFKDPRICFALSYASKGGALLRKEPYKADIINQQLDDQVRKFVSLSKGLILDKEKSQLQLSTVFSIYTHAFINSKYAEIKKFRSRKTEERAWLNFLLDYLPEDDAKYLEKNDVKISIFKFDWTLNDSSQ